MNVESGGGGASTQPAGSTPSHTDAATEAGRYDTANFILHSILDDRPPDSQISPSGALLHVVDRFYRNENNEHRLWSLLDTITESPQSAMSERVQPEPPGERPQGDQARGQTQLERSSQPPQISNEELPSIDRIFSMLPSRGQLTPTSLEGAAGRQSGSTSNHSRGQRREPGSSSLRFRSLLDSVGLPSPSLDDSAEEAHRPKRRRLDSRKPTPDFKAIRYGRYGQVEPGQLKMEIVSCDGGMYSNELSYAAENILKDDASVYCTQSPRCNIVLRHQGETVFNLTELVIKAPRNNYTSPVQEGMVFIAMDNDDVLSRTASFQIQPPLSMRGSSRSRNRSRDQWSDIARAFSVLYDSEVPISELLGGHDEDENLYSSRAERLAQAYRRRRAAMASQFPPEFSHGRATFRVTTECSDSDTDEDSDRDDQGGPTTGGGHRGDIPAWAFSGMRSSRTIPNRIGSLPFETDGNEDEDFDDDEEEPLDHNDATDSEGSDRDESIFAGLVGMRDALGAGTGPGRFTFGESRTLRAGELDFLPENTFNAIMRSLQPSQHLARESSGAGRRLSPDRIMAPSQSELAGGSSTGQSASRGPAVGGSGMRSTTGAGSAASRDNSNDRSGSRRGSRVPPPPPPLPQQQQQQQRPQTLAEVAEAAQLATQEAVRAVGGQVLFPLCHFHIERGNSRCRLRFDPPASGRFLLLKMWSPNPHHDGKGNIDIQAVVAKGFAGPRYFPAVQLR